MHGIAFLNRLLSNSILPRLSQPCKKATANPLLFLKTRDYCPRLILTSLVFMSMVTALTTWNSRIGAFFSLILLLLQLASSAGTYPLALTNDFFRAINPWLPMSYSVSGLRQTISMTGNIHHQVIFLAVILALFIGLGMLAYQPKKMEED